MFLFKLNLRAKFSDKRDLTQNSKKILFINVIKQNLKTVIALLINPDKRLLYFSIRKFSVHIQYHPIIIDLPYYKLLPSLARR